MRETEESENKKDPLLKRRIDVYIEELKLLRDEELLDIRQRNIVRIAVWSTVGAVYGFILSKDSILEIDAILVIPVITFVYSLFWAETQGRIESFHIYIRDKIAPKVRGLFGDIETPAETDGTLLGWEDSEICSKFRDKRKYVRNIFDIITFLFIPITAIIWFFADESHNKTLSPVACFEIIFVFGSAFLLGIIENLRTKKGNKGDGCTSPVIR